MKIVEDRTETGSAGTKVKVVDGNTSLLAVTNLSAYAGNKRGNGAVDLQHIRGALSSEDPQEQVASGNFSVALGACNTASGECSTAFGWHNTASGQYSMAIGANNYAESTSAVAFGANCHARTGGSIAFGSETDSSGAYSTTMGRKTRAVGTGSSALGFFNRANKSCAVATGTNVAINQYGVVGNGNDFISNVGGLHYVDAAEDPYNLSYAAPIKSYAGFIGCLVKSGDPFFQLLFSDIIVANIQIIKISNTSKAVGVYTVSISHGSVDILFGAEQLPITIAINNNNELYISSTEQSSDIFQVAMWFNIYSTEESEILYEVDDDILISNPVTSDSVDGTMLTINSGRGAYSNNTLDLDANA